MSDLKSQDRPTIGFLTANIHIGASRVLWPGILEAAVSGNVNWRLQPDLALWSRLMAVRECRRCCYISLTSMVTSVSP